MNVLNVWIQNQNYFQVPSNHCDLSYKHKHLLRDATAQHTTITP